MDRNMKKWHSYKLSDVVRFNPSERLLKGEIAKKVPMDLLQPYTRGISGFEMASYTGGSKFRNGDTLMARITPCLENGKTAYVSMLDEDEVGFGSTEYIVFRNIEGITDNKFVYYFVTSPWFRDIAVKSMVGSSGRQRVQQAMLENLVVNLPPLAEQKQIAGILGALDDKIELNRCINENLEQQVQALFKAWFVDFEPFKDGEFVDSELGMIPKAWKIKPLEYLVEKVKSGDWGKDEPTGNYTKKTFCMRGADFPDIKEGNKGKMPIRYILEKNFNDKSLCDGNVVVEISGGSPTQSTGRIVLVDRAFVADCGNALICTNFCKSLEIKEDYSMFFYLLWQYLYDLRVMFIYENGSNGLKNLNVNSLIERESFVIPTKEVVSKFNSVVSDLLSTKQANGIEVSRLASLRDTLLPKLMSGELKNSEIETEK